MAMEFDLLLKDDVFVQDSAMTKRQVKTRDLIGWREWVAVPTLGIDRIKAKIDSGARSSSLHATDIRIEQVGSRERVYFRVFPRQRSKLRSIECVADVIEHREIRSSNGSKTIRPVIACQLEMHGQRWTIEVTLADRKRMGFRMLLGREAFRKRFLLDVGRSYLGGT